MIYEHPYTTGSHTHSLSHTHTIAPTWEQILATTRAHYERKEPEMTTLEKVHRERKEAAERERIEAVYETLDAQDLGELPDGTVLRFDIDATVERTYAVLHHSGRWWATGGTAPNGVGLEDLLAWMIRKGVDPSTLVVLS